MKCPLPHDATHKDVIVIGNGPSGIALSFMLDGNLPYVTSNYHPDEMLSARLRSCVGKSLVREDLDFLSEGLEGRSTNPVSLLLDSLTHPCADIGIELDPLVEWRRNGVQIDHVVFGKGPPGGSWHSMDPNILTLSLGAWMALPGLKYTMRDNAEKRAFARNVAKYYEQYVKTMNLDRYFENHCIVVNIQELVDQKECNGKNANAASDEDCTSSLNNEVTMVSERLKLCNSKEMDVKQIKPFCPLTSALSFLLSRGYRKQKNERCCNKRKFDSKCKWNSLSEQFCNGGDGINECRHKKINSNRDDNRSVSFSCDYKLFNNNDKVDMDAGQSNSTNCDPSTSREAVRPAGKPRWVVEVYDMKTKGNRVYTCDDLVLAVGASDLPNKLSISDEKDDPAWLLHDVRSLEIELELYLQHNRKPDPVLIVGAGLSAADAIIATRAKNVPVIHLFRDKSRDLSKQLPENMYPEYHKVNQMMQRGGTSYPLYTAYPEYTLTDYSDSERSVTITSKEGKDAVTLNVSFAVVLIGSRPDLGFLPKDLKIAINDNYSVDSKTNPVNIDKLTHSVRGHDHLYAIGPIAGDHFVRFLPGGGLAVVSDLYKRNNY